MDPIARMVAAGAAGASGGDATYVDDVFSTTVWDGTGLAHEITTGIDNTENSLLWTKSRNYTNSHRLYTPAVDTSVGHPAVLYSNISNGVGSTGSSDVTGYTANGFTVAADSNANTGMINSSNLDYVGWNFKAAPGFFDVVTYTGSGSARTVSHNLGSVPGMIIIKSTSNTENWQVWHRSVTGHLELDSSAAVNSSSIRITAVSSTDFTLATFNTSNANGQTYVAYIFAHDDQSFGTDSDESIIKCGSFTTNGSGYFTEVNLGWEPQWLLIKRSDSATAGTWLLIDNMRGLGAGASNFLYPNNTNAEASNSVGFVHLTPTGFKGASATQQQTNATYIYMAIRRPHKPPTAGTEVFAIDNQGTGTMPPQYHSNFVVDWAFNVAFGESQAYRYRLNFTRLLGRTALKLSETSAEINFSSAHWDYMDGFYFNNSSVSTTYAWMFKRAPGFFDVVTYDGTGSVQNIPHNLGDEPKMMIVKRRDGIPHWQWWHYSLGAGGLIQSAGTTPNGGWTNVNHWNNTLPTATHFTVGTDGDVNISTGKYVSYLFGTLDGISKVGTYSGTGGDINVNCGFAAGARFVMIKRIGVGESGDFYIWDSLRGITSGNDPYMLLNSTDAQVTNTDYIDPLNSGFTVTSSAPAALNTNGGTYLFLAIA